MVCVIAGRMLVGRKKSLMISLASFIVVRVCQCSGHTAASRCIPAKPLVHICPVHSILQVHVKVVERFHWTGCIQLRRVNTSARSAELSRAMLTLPGQSKHRMRHSGGCATSEAGRGRGMISNLSFGLSARSAAAAASIQAGGGGTAEGGGRCKQNS